MREVLVQAVKRATLLASFSATGFAAPVMIGRVPVETPSSLLFGARVAWLRDWKGVVFQSIDGGKSWSEVSAGGIDTNGMVYVVSESALQEGLVIVNQTHSFLMTSDSRMACGRLPLASERPQETFPVAIAISPSAGTQLLSMGTESSDGFVTRMYIASGCGQSWRPLSNLPTNVAVKYLNWSDSGAVFAGNSCVLFVSRDSGGKWRKSIFSPDLCAQGQEPEKIRALQFFSGKAGVLSLERGRLYKTTDGGETWVRVSSPDREQTKWPTAYDAGVVCFEDESRGWLVGGESELLATRDGGRSWEEWGGLGQIARLARNREGRCLVLSDGQLYLLRR